MKLVSYAGQQLVTTDDVADALVVLAAEIANEGGSQALQIPIVVDGENDLAELVVGLGNDVLVGPHSSDGADPDFSEHAERLRTHPSYPRRLASEGEGDGDGEDDKGNEWVVDFDLDAGTTRH
ncbi:hypothetical protein ACTJKK_15705 [Microbacterium sp. 22179]|uniref:hypothetical protein n=1 Tax=Microbacterium sp. 22179 TaxID=3453886 RepID=UPI003F84D818